MKFRGVVAVVSLLAIALLAAGCGGTGGSGVVKATESAAGSTVSVKVGQTLEVELEGNPTTGYEWTVADPAGNVLEQQGEPEFKTSSTLAGAPGMYTFTFKAAGKGETELKFTYKRSWETTPQDKALTFQVSVK